MYYKISFKNIHKIITLYSVLITYIVQKHRKQNTWGVR